ncbi:oxidoreductase [Umezawaea endophytica]|uniref:Oxidoreductase n=1 Tax=Umezawaea endophytica TaxID=1654476 RepID=A0A9X2VQW9_9PSEU|nr:oxidoreductase [Umezawaea endophytica]MCS7480672.1 oxidoreductase [Umezawaea endophytica]
MGAKWTNADIPDQTGRTVVITGATSGIGLITARELAGAGARVVLAVRDPAKGRAVAATLPGRTEVRELDVSRLRSVREFAEAWRGRIDVLVNNAGIMQVPEARTEDGFELQTATNFLGPFALTTLLLPHVTDRVVTVSSQLHRISRIDLTDLAWASRKYDDLRTYADSKLAVLLFTLELQRRLAEAGSPVRSLAAHPGIATTNLVAHRGRSATPFSFLLNDPEHGALPTLFAATQDVPGGSYVGPDGVGGVKGHPKIGTPSRRARDPRLARELWDVASRLTTADTATRAPQSGK